MFDPSHPLTRLWHYARNHRAHVVWSVIASIGNRAFDLTPPLSDWRRSGHRGAAARLLFGAVRAHVNVMTQLWVLAAITLLVWGLESVTDYIAEVLVAQPRADLAA